MGRNAEIEKSNTVRAISLSAEHYKKLEQMINDKKHGMGQFTQVYSDEKTNFSKKVRSLMNEFIDRVEDEGAYNMALKLMGYSPVPSDVIVKNFRCSNSLYKEYVKYSKSLGIEPMELLRRLVALEIGEFENTFTPHKLSQELQNRI